MKIACNKPKPALSKQQVEALTELRKKGPLQTTKLRTEQKPINFGLFNEAEHVNQISMF